MKFHPLAPRPRTAASQRGLSVIEPLIAMLLLTFVGLGVSYGASRAASAQRFANVHTLSVVQLRSLLQSEGMAKDCTVAGNQVSRDISIAQGVSLSSVVKTCSVETLTVSVGGKSQTVSVPNLRFDVTDNSLLGNDQRLVLQN